MGRPTPTAFEACRGSTELRERTSALVALVAAVAEAAAEPLDGHAQEPNPLLLTPPEPPVPASANSTSTSGAHLAGGVGTVAAPADPEPPAASALLALTAPTMTNVLAQLAPFEDTMTALNAALAGLTARTTPPPVWQQLWLPALGMGVAAYAGASYLSSHKVGRCV